MDKEGQDNPNLSNDSDDLNDVDASVEESQIETNTNQTEQPKIDPKNGVVFKTEKIGDKATTEYFSNVKGEDQKKNNEAIERRRVKITRKTLFIIFGTLIGIILVVMLIFVIVNLINPQGKKYTAEDFPDNMTELENKAVEIAFEVVPDGQKVSFLTAADYIDQAIENTTDEDRKFELKTLHARMMMMAGYGYAATKEIEKLEPEANTDQRKYQLYRQAAFVYFYYGDKSLAEQYADKADALDVPENQGEWIGDDDGE